jgi:hypothetical protein
MRVSEEPRCPRGPAWNSSWCGCLAISSISLSSLLLGASGPPRSEAAAPCQALEALEELRGSRSYRPAAGQVLPGSAGLRCSPSGAGLYHDDRPSCRVSWRVRDGALAALPRWPPRSRAAASLPQEEEPLPDELGLNCRASVLARRGWGLADPLRFHPTDWFAVPRRVARMLARQPPPRRSGDASWARSSVAVPSG